MKTIVIFDDEKWMDVDFPGIIKDSYQISSHGRVYSKIKNRIINPANHTQGYHHITLIGNGGKYKKILVHRLVAWHFVKGRTYKRKFVNHKNGNKKFNHYLNLEWATHLENVQHSVRTGLNTSGEQFKTRYLGSANPNFRYPDEVVMRMCELIERGVRSKDISKMIMEEYPDKNFKEYSTFKYVQSKIKSKLYRTDISSKYNF